MTRRLQIPRNLSLDERTWRILHAEAQREAWSVSALIRERFRLKRHVRAVSAHGRMTGWILSMLPMAIAAILAVVAPGYIDIMFRDPLGRMIVVTALVMQAIGAFIMRRIIDIEI